MYKMTYIKYLCVDLVEIMKVTQLITNVTCCSFELDKVTSLPASYILAFFFPMDGLIQALLC